MKKIVVIDDFEDSCQLIAEILSPFYEVKYICQAEKALEFVKQVTPDLIIMDYKMPYVTGVELCKIFRDTASIKEIPIIFVSGAATSDERIETLESGGDDFLSKPFHPKELLLRVQKRLSYQDRIFEAPQADRPVAAPVAGLIMVRVSPPPVSPYGLTTLFPVFFA